MTTDKAFEREVAAAMAELASVGDADEAIDQILAITSRSRPMPRWLALLKEPPMRTSSEVLTGSPTLRRVAVLVITLVLIVAAAGAIVAATRVLQPPAPALPDPFGVARNGALAYEAMGDIYTSGPTGDHPVAIITGSAVDSRPSYSRDGTMISFVRRESASPDRLMVARSDGTGAVPVAEWPAWSDWSPDSTELAVLHPIGGKSAISIVAADGGGTPRTLDLGGVEPDAWVAWRPGDRNVLLFRGHPQAGSTDVALYSVGSDGTALRPITSEFAPDPPGSATFSDPEIAPDGATLAYWTWGPDDASQGHGLERLIDLETGTERMAEAYGGAVAAFSPDGRSIVGQGDGQLMIQSSDGSSPAKPLGPAFGLSNGQRFYFSPDGTKVYLTLDSPMETWIIDVAGGTSVRTTQGIPNPPTSQRLAP